MARGKAIKVEGLDELIKQLGGLKQVEGLMQPGRMKAAQIVQSAIEAEAPRGPTGNLKRSIEINPSVLSKRSKNLTFVAINHKVAPHAHLVEFGARGGNMPENAFFTRGYRKSRSSGADALMADAKAAIDKAL